MGRMLTLSASIVGLSSGSCRMLSSYPGQCGGEADSVPGVVRLIQDRQWNKVDPVLTAIVSSEHPSFRPKRHG